MNNFQFPLVEFVEFWCNIDLTDFNNSLCSKVIIKRLSEKSTLHRNSNKDNYPDILGKSTTLTLAINAALTTTMVQCRFYIGLRTILDTKRSLSFVIEPQHSRSVPGNKANCPAK